jgi:hypothetical protein
MTNPIETLAATLAALAAASALQVAIAQTAWVEVRPSTNTANGVLTPDPEARSYMPEFCTNRDVTCVIVDTPEDGRRVIGRSKPSSSSEGGTDGGGARAPDSGTFRPGRRP